MAGSLVEFETKQYEKHEISSFIYEPIYDDKGELEDFRVVYASDIFAKDWLNIYHNEDYLGAGLKSSTLMDEYSLQMMERFITEEPHSFVTYMPLVNLHLFFDPIRGLPKPYAGFYLTDITDHASREAKSQFLRHIRQLKNNSLLMQIQDDGRIEPVYISDEFAKMMECTVADAKERVSGIGFYKSINAEDRPLVRSMMEHRVSYDGGSELTIQVITAKCHSIWCNVHYGFIDDFGEHFVYCTYTDVTALKEHEERLRSTYSSLGNNFYQDNESTLANFRVNLTKNSFEEIKGTDLYETDSINYSYSDAIKERAKHLPVPSERTRFLMLFDRAKLISDYSEGNVNISQVLYCLREQNRACFVRFSVSLTVHPLTGDIVAFIAEQECNSEKVKGILTDKILTEEFDMVAYLVDGSYGITIGDPSRIKHGSIFPTANRGDYGAYLKNQVYSVLSGSEEEKKELIEALSFETVRHELQKREPYVVNIKIEMGGEIYYKQFDFYRVDAEVEFYILLKSDTTEIQKQHLALNEQLTEALDAANQANVAKTAFLSSMSHEIRTPMNAIIGLDSIALSNPDLPEQTREQLEKIGGSARHLLGLINDILDMSRIESGRMSVKNEEFSFAEMLEQINTMAGSQCQNNELIYDCRLLSKVDDYYIGDAMKLKQVIINILGNAVKFTESGGTVQFFVEKVAEFDGQSTLRFTIKDTGIGMDKDYLPKIFEAFSQEKEGQSNKYGSTGLGMAITKNIVELMNGAIDVESEKGVGTTFTVTVTLRNSDRKTHKLSDVSPKDLKVLVIDDDPIACEHARLVLEEIGIASDTVQSGAEAIDLIELKGARREEYNLIFVDWKMPEQDGIEVTRKIRKLMGQDSAVIVLTAYRWDDIEDEALAAGVDSFMAKPLFASNVLAAYQHAMVNKQVAGETKKLAVLAGRRILLAEDMPINAEIMKELLKMKEIEADHAENGQIAVDMFADSATGTYDAVLMDVRMPVLDGLGATQAIRALDREDAKSIPIIAMTANAFDEDVQRSLQAGMNAHLTKPVDPERLYETLGELIED